MKELETLEQELLVILDNIKRVKKFANEPTKKAWKPYQSHVFGELKHRLIAIKQTFVMVQKLATYHLFEEHRNAK